MGSLRRRFLLLLVLLGLGSAAPWFFAEHASSRLDGTAVRVDLAGSLRYRTAALMAARQRGDSADAARLVAKQLEVLDRLVQGGDGVPPCLEEVLCQRLLAHRRFWVQAGHAGAGAFSAELAAIDDTVHIMAAAAEGKVAELSRRLRWVGVVSLGLVLLVGVGVGDVFFRIRRFQVATAGRDEEALARAAHRDDELGALAWAMAQGLREERTRSEYERRRVEQVARQQRALEGLARDLAFASALLELSDIPTGAAVLARDLGRLVPHDEMALVVCDSRGASRGWRVVRSQVSPIPSADSERLKGSARIEGDTLILPLRFKESPVGALWLVRERPRFNAEELSTLRAQGPILVSALRRMQLEEELRLSRQLAAVGGFGRMLADEARNLLNALSLRLKVVSRRTERISMSDDVRASLQAGLDDLEQSVKALALLVDEYHGLSQGSAGALEDQDLVALVRAGVDAMAPLFRTYGIDVRLELGEGPAVAKVDRRRIHQLLRHLLTNAVEAMASQADRRLQVELKRAAGGWTLLVRDSGPGLTELARLFTPGFTTKPHHSGMGLALCYQIAALHRGQLVARNADAGGAEIELALPAADLTAGTEDANAGRMSQPGIPHQRRETVGAYLTEDHDEIDGILSSVREMVEDGEWERAEVHYGDFSERLLRHIAIEEEVLFPRFSAKYGPGGPVAVMEAEHGVIREAVDTMRTGIARADSSAFTRGYDALMRVLPGHNHKEEEILYPAIDRLLESEMTVVLERIRSM